ncbi:hypothetical protein Daus18300_003406 [Diaporthe australafricana]|uniref:Haloacid dehalogenase-like hydrolase n=1 Tax=Diaporthe australafricana TaxID=127596 RepID=A0ABR3XGF8_9PEZI
MFGEMRNALSISKEIDILDHIYSLPTPEDREKAMESIRDIERTAMSKQQAQPGLVELMTYIDSKSLPKGICTRNFDAPVDHLLTKFLAAVQPFHPIITREFRPPKPDPAGILHIARSWGLTQPRGRGTAGHGGGGEELKKVFMTNGAEVKSEVVEGGGGGPGKEGEGDEADGSGLIMVGDSIDDMTAGRRARAATVLLVNPANEHLAAHEHTDLVIGRLDELIGHLENGFTGRET